jgi:acetolactate synthase-1/2/3 large subunit
MSPLKATGMSAQGTGAHAVVSALKRHGVDTIFGQSLPSMVHLVAEKQGIRQIAYRTENAGGYMADAYARVSGKIGVVTAQNGPAAALLVPPLAEALKASIPILALVQDVSAEHTDRNAFQDLDHIGMFTAVTKWVRRVHDVSRIEDYIDQAMTVAWPQSYLPRQKILSSLLAEACIYRMRIKHSQRCKSSAIYPSQQQSWGKALWMKPIRFRWGS